jgi:deoxyhypusine synthase
MRQVRASVRCTVFLAYTSNLVSSGLRESLRFLVQHRMVDVLVTTAGGVEEDVIKCLGPTLLGDFALSGRDLRKRGINRIGNLLVPNSNYCLFEDWLTPILHAMADEQERDGTRRVTGPRPSPGRTDRPWRRTVMASLDSSA